MATNICHLDVLSNMNFYIMVSDIKSWFSTGQLLYNLWSNKLTKWQIFSCVFEVQSEGQCVQIACN